MYVYSSYMHIYIYIYIYMSLPQTSSGRPCTIQFHIMYYQQRSIACQYDIGYMVYCI